MRKKNTKRDQIAFATERMRELIRLAISESVRTAGMSAGEFLTSFHDERPGAHFPSMIDGHAITWAEDEAVTEWAKLARSIDKRLSAISDSRTWERAVKSAYVAVSAVASGESPDHVNEEVLKLARENVNQQLGTVTHYLPCFLFDTDAVEAIQVGDVQFIRGESLPDQVVAAGRSEPQWYAAYRELSADPGSRRNTDWRARTVWEISRFPWVAIVSTTGFEYGMARRRAADMARLALAGIGLNVSPRQCAALSLAYEWCKPKQERTLAQIPGKDVVTGVYSHDPQVRADKADLNRFLSSHADYLSWLGRVIAEAFESNALSQPNALLRQAWLNGLHWYYAGCFEPSDSRATICFSTALESLCEAEGVQSIVTALETLFGICPDAYVVRSRKHSLQSAVEHIYGFGRSESVHGGTFVVFGDYSEVRGLASELARYALIAFNAHLQAYEALYQRREAADRKDAFYRWMASRNGKNAQ